MRIFYLVTILALLHPVILAQNVNIPSQEERLLLARANFSAAFLNLDSSVVDSNVSAIVIINEGLNGCTDEARKCAHSPTLLIDVKDRMGLEVKCERDEGVPVCVMTGSDTRKILKVTNKFPRVEVARIQRWSGRIWCSHRR